MVTPFFVVRRVWLPYDGNHEDAASEQVYSDEDERQNVHGKETQRNGETFKDTVALHARQQAVYDKS